MTSCLHSCTLDPFCNLINSKRKEFNSKDIVFVPGRQPVAILDTVFVLSAIASVFVLTPGYALHLQIV